MRQNLSVLEKLKEFDSINNARFWAKKGFSFLDGISRIFVLTKFRMSITTTLCLFCRLDFYYRILMFITDGREQKVFTRETNPRLLEINKF